MKHVLAYLGSSVKTTILLPWERGCKGVIVLVLVFKSGALSIYEKNSEISVIAKVEFPIGKKLFHLVVSPGTWRGARPWTWNGYKVRET